MVASGQSTDVPTAVLEAKKARDPRWWYWKQDATERAVSFIETSNSSDPWSTSVFKKPPTIMTHFG